MIEKLIQQVEQDYLKADVPQFEVGDTVDVHTKILEGDKERTQIFSGTVIAAVAAGRGKCSRSDASWPVKVSSGSSRCTPHGSPRSK